MTCSYSSKISFIVIFDSPAQAEPVVGARVPSFTLTWSKGWERSLELTQGEIQNRNLS